MSVSVEAISLLIPTFAANAIFASRRAKRGIDELDNNPLYALSNFGIASGQALKCYSSISAINNQTMQEGAKNAIELTSTTIKDSAKSSSFVKGLSSTVNFISDHINPVIYAAGGLKVLGSDDKVETAVQEILALGSMRLCEEGFKNLSGMPKIVTDPITGERVTKSTVAAITKCEPLNDAIKSFTKYCSETKVFGKISLKPVPSIIKGTLFVTASILGYKIGRKIADYLLNLGVNKDKEGKEKS